ncbi:hypothetical protein QVD17_11309 [Tagetes erecta]|uniref:Uncharacterized protein n=1 Tax=Tagetes erecta TaxID=13708 RepID=A0AAD8P1Y5_TARER|nr:hypothetical protein QVD17_11309 [Tagetes erecta]
MKNNTHDRRRWTEATWSFDLGFVEEEARALLKWIGRLGRIRFNGEGDCGSAKWQCVVSCLSQLLEEGIKNTPHRIATHLGLDRRIGNTHV